jgi:hypothetical protein
MKGDIADDTSHRLALTNDELESRLCCLAAEIAVREAEFLGVLAELDRR